MKEFGFNNENFKDGFDQEKMIKNIILPFPVFRLKIICICNIFVRQSIRSFRQIILQETKGNGRAQEKALDEIKAAIKDHKHQSKATPVESQKYQ